eukprot:1578140-Prymnesium_polylepis.1
MQPSRPASVLTYSENAALFMFTVLARVQLYSNQYACHCQLSRDLTCINFQHSSFNASFLACGSFSIRPVHLNPRCQEAVGLTASARL